MHNAPSPEAGFLKNSVARRWGWFLAIWACIRIAELLLHWN